MKHDIFHISSIFSLLQDGCTYSEEGGNGRIPKRQRRWSKPKQHRQPWTPRVSYGPLVWAPTRNPNKHQLYTKYKRGAHRTDPTRIQQRPVQGCTGEPKAQNRSKIQPILSSPYMALYRLKRSPSKGTKRFPRGP